MAVVSPGARLEGWAMRLVITGGLLLVQAVNDASTRINANKTKVNFFTAYSFPY